MPKAIDQQPVKAPDASDSVGNFDIGSSAVELGNEAFKLPDTPQEAQDALAAVGGKQDDAGTTLAKTGDSTMEAAGELVPGFDKQGGGLAFSSIEGYDNAEGNDATAKDANGDAEQNIRREGMQFAGLAAMLDGGPSQAAADKVDAMFAENGRSGEGINYMDRGAADNGASENPHYVLDENSWNIQNNNNGIA